jgi:ubiquinone/menaquinone biosynthesis C-methylase UbiE
VTGFEREWQARFEKFASRHEAEHLVSGWSDGGLRRRVALFNRLLDAGLFPAGAKVLDVGCGAGTYVRLLAKRGCEVIGLDYSAPTLVRARAADPARPDRYLAGDAYQLPFRDAAFDAVVCIGVLQAVARTGHLVAELARVARAGGCVLVESLNPWDPKAAVLRLRSRLGGRPTRLHYDSPASVARALGALGFARVRTVGILLPPRSLPVLARVADSPTCGRLLGGVPGVRQLIHHAHWTIAQRGAERGADGRRP